MQNEIRVCTDCKKEFELTPGWDRLIKEHPEILPPKRCYACRQKRKAEKRGDNSNSRY